MTKRFTQLTNIDVPDNADLFALSDLDTSQSKKITFSNLKAAIIDSSTFSDNQALMVTALNAYDPSSNGKNTLKASQLFYNGEYRDGSYFVTYANISGTPTIPSNLNQLTNSDNFIRYNEPTQKMISDGTTDFDMTSDFVNEGTTNLFFTNDRADSRVNTLFGGLFNTFNSTFDKGDVRDSISGESGTFVSTRVSEAQTQSKTIRMTDYSKLVSFSAGQILRLYGASTLFESTTLTSGLSLSPEGFQTAASQTAGNTGGVTGFVTLSYKIAEFDVASGEISPASAAVAIAIKTPTALLISGGHGTDVPTTDAFNTDNFIKLNFSNVPSDKGIAVYRQQGETGDWKLIAVLGRKEADASEWIDFYTFDYTTWSGKNSDDNTYTSITHFPLTAPASAVRGWVDKTITSVVDNTNSFNIELDDWVFVNLPDGSATISVDVAHNDTSLIKGAILANSTAGKKSVVLNAKTYNTSAISMPDNFGLVGTSYITKLKKLPWSGGGDQHSKIIYSEKSQNAKNISIVGVDIDGNAPEQFLWADSTATDSNYLLNFGINCDSLLIDRVRLTNAPAGGIYAPSPIEMKINTSEVVNSGLTDRYSYSPLVADAGTTTLIIGNRFENYTNFVDVSVTTKGVIANNIINNCGSGLFVYGSTFLVSSPNVLMGPANEFLPTPDILNSEFDSININLSEALAANTGFESPSFVYQEDGAVYDLTQTDGTISTLEHRAFYLQKTASGVESVWGTVIAPSAATVGNVYTIVSLGTGGSATPQSVWNTMAGTTNQIYIVNSEFTQSSSIGSGNGKITSGAVDGITLNPRVGNLNKVLGQFGFDIPGSMVTSIKVAGETYAYNTLQTANPLHIGMGWSSSYKHEVTAGTISGTGSWAVDPDAPSGAAQTVGNPKYTMTVLNVKYLAVGSKVRFAGSTHSAWSNPNGVITGIVESVSAESAGERTVVVSYPGGGGGDTQVSTNLANGTGGTINIIDNFVLAQGRII